MSTSITSPFECRNLADVLWSRAALHPERPAFRFIGPSAAGRRSLGYAELLESARRVAGSLVRTGPPDQRVMLLLPPSLELVCAFYGCLLARRTVVLSPPPRKPRDEQVIGRRLAQLQPVSLVTPGSVNESLRGLLAEAAIPVHSFAALQAGPPLPERIAPDAARPVLIQSTSGSTSAPAGCRITDENLLHNSRVIHQGFAHTSKSVGLVWTPPYHDMGLIGGVVQPVYAGFTTLLMAPRDFIRDPLSWLRAISDHQVTTSGGPDFAYELCVRAAEGEPLEDLDLGSWTVAYSGAEPVRAATLGRFTRRFSRHGFRRESFLPCYGLAESTLMVSGVPVFRAPVEASAVDVLRPGPSNDAPTRVAPAQWVGCGFADAETTVRIVDPETRVPCAPRRVGEIWLQGPSVAAGYHDDPERTREVFEARLADRDEGPFLRTGDLGVVYRRELFVVGRLKDLIILNGVNHHPEDLEESAQRASLGVRAGCIAAFAVETRGGEALVLMAEVEDGTPPAALDQIVDSIRTRLRADFERAPDDIVLLEPGRIPRTQSGKVRRSACLRLFLDGDMAPLRHERSPRAAGDDGPPAGADPVPEMEPPDISGLSPEARRERIILQIDAWLRRDLRLTQPLPRDANLAAFGIDSILATQLAARIARWLRWPLDPMLVWSYPNLDGLGDFLSSPPPEEMSAMSSEHDPILPAGLATTGESAPTGEADLAAPADLPRARRPLADASLPPTPAEARERQRKRREFWRLLRHVSRLQQDGQAPGDLPPIGRVVARDWSPEMISMYVRSNGRRSYIDQPCRLPMPVPAKPLAAVDRFELSEADIERFYRQSYLGPYHLMSAEEANRMGAEVLTHIAAPSAIYGFPSVRDRHLDMPRLADLFRRPEITERLAQLLGPDLICWRSQLFHKEPGDPAIEWHQASTYLLEDRLSPILRPPNPDRLFQLTVWLAFNDATEENGCLEMFPGSHHRIRTVRRSEESGFYNARYMLELEKEIGTPVKVPVRAGEFVIFTERVVHGSGPNRTGRSRCGYNFRVVPPDVTVYQYKTKQRTVHEPDGRPTFYDLAKWRPVVLRTR